jgi:hypothetical protein
LHRDDEKDEDYQISDEDSGKDEEDGHVRKRDRKGQIKKKDVIEKPPVKAAVNVLRLMDTARAFRLKNAAVNNQTTRLFFEGHTIEGN